MRSGSNHERKLDDTTTLLTTKQPSDGHHFKELLSLFNDGIVSLIP